MRTFSDYRNRSSSGGNNGGANIVVGLLLANLSVGLLVLSQFGGFAPAIWLAVLTFGISAVLCIIGARGLVSGGGEK